MQAWAEVVAYLSSIETQKKQKRMQCSNLLSIATKVSQSPTILQDIQTDSTENAIYEQSVLVLLDSSINKRK